MMRPCLSGFCLKEQFFLPGRVGKGWESDVGMEGIKRYLRGVFFFPGRAGVEM